MATACGCGSAGTHSVNSFHHEPCLSGTSAMHELNGFRSLAAQDAQCTRATMQLHTSLYTSNNSFHWLYIFLTPDQPLITPICRTTLSLRCSYQGSVHAPQSSCSDRATTNDLLSRVAMPTVDRRLAQ